MKTGQGQCGSVGWGERGTKPEKEVLGFGCHSVLKQPTIGTNEASAGEPRRQQCWSHCPLLHPHRKREEMGKEKGSRIRQHRATC